MAIEWVMFKGGGGHSYKSPSFLKEEPSLDGILLPKLFWPTVRKNCSRDQENFWNLKLKAENLQKFWEY